MKKYLRAADIAESLGISVSCVWRWVQRGILPRPFSPTQRSTFFDAEKVQEALDKIQADQAS